MGRTHTLWAACLVCVSGLACATPDVGGADLCLPSKWKGEYVRNALVIDYVGSGVNGSTEVGDGYATYDLEKGYFAARESGTWFPEVLNTSLPLKENYTIHLYQKGIDTWVAVSTPIGSPAFCLKTNLTERLPEKRCLDTVRQKFSRYHFGIPSEGMYNGKIAKFGVINNDTAKDARIASAQIALMEDSHDGAHFPLTATFGQAITSRHNSASVLYVQDVKMSNYKAEFDKELFRLPAACEPGQAVEGGEADRVALRFSNVLRGAALAGEQGSQPPQAWPTHPAGANGGGSAGPAVEAAAAETAFPEEKTRYCQAKESTYDLFSTILPGSLVGKMTLLYEEGGQSQFGFNGTFIVDKEELAIRLVQKNTGGPAGRIYIEWEDKGAHLPSATPFAPYGLIPTPANSEGYSCFSWPDGRYLAGLDRCREATGPKHVEVNGRPAKIFKYESSYFSNLLGLYVNSTSYSFQGEDELLLGFMNATQVEPGGDVVDIPGAATLFNPKPVADHSILAKPKTCFYFVPSPLIYAGKEAEAGAENDYEGQRAPAVIGEEPEREEGPGGSPDQRRKEEVAKAVIDYFAGLAL